MKLAVLKTQPIGRALRACPIGWVLSTACFICRTSINVSKSIFLMTDSTKVLVYQELEYLSCICGFVRSKQERLLCEWIYLICFWCRWTSVQNKDLSSFSIFVFIYKAPHTLHTHSPRYSMYITSTYKHNNINSPNKNIDILNGNKLATFLLFLLLSNNATV